MALEFDSNLIKVSQVLFEDATQNIVEGDIIIPDTKPDVISIIHQEAEVRILSQEAYKDVLVIRGFAKFKILYMSDDPSRFICSLEQSINFEQSFNLRSDEENVSNYCDCRVEHVDGTILNGRKLNVKAIISADLKTVKKTEVNAVTNINDAEFVTQNISTQNDIEAEPVDLPLSFETEVPFGISSVKEILRTDGFIKNKEVKLAGNKIVINGTIEIRSLYATDMQEECAEYVTNDFDFYEVLDSPELSENNNIFLELERIEPTVKQDEDGDDRVLRYDVDIKVRMYSIEKQDLDIITDAYSTVSKLEFEKEPVKVRTVVGETKDQLSMKELVNIPAGSSAKKVYNVLLKPVITDVKVEQDKIYVDGIIETNAIYFSNSEKPLVSNKQDIPFSSLVEVAGAKPFMRPEARVEIDGVTFNLIDENQIELKLVITTFVRVLDEDNYDVITGVAENPLDNNNVSIPSMTVYYVQAGDTLWRIAKRYLTTVSELVKINKIENPDIIFIGQQLLIPKAS